MTPDPQPSLLVADLPLGPEETFLRDMGDWFGWVCLAGMAGFLAFVVLVSVRNKGEDCKGDFLVRCPLWDQRVVKYRSAFHLRTEREICSGILNNPMKLNP